jgi:acyl dehydratase
MDIAALQALELPAIHHAYTRKDSILYALGIGFGERPTDPVHLQFVYEKNLRALPSASVVLAHPGMWIKATDLKINWLKLVHAEQSFEIFKPLPPEGRVTGTYKVQAVEDRGSEKGASLHLEKKLFDSSTKDLLAVVTSTYLLRGDGGQGGFGTPTPPLDALPAAQPSYSWDAQTLPQSALLYRLSGDMNILHADPAAAAAAGFSQPILQGLCTLGIATRGLIETVAHGDADRVRKLSVRFSKPVLPGDKLRFEFYEDDVGARFCARSTHSGLMVLDRGTAWIDSGRT